jgi:hypothetical protein
MLGIDWLYHFRPACLALLALRSPYSDLGFYNPPWALLPLLPLAVLPAGVGYAVLFALSVLALAYTAYKLGATPGAMACLLLSPPTVHCLLNGNIDLLVCLGFVLPPRWGLFFATAKPQVGAGMAFYWLLEAWHSGGWRGVARTFWPVTVALFVSLLLFGPWPLAVQDIAGNGWNASLWPYTLPAGLVLLVVAARHRRVEYAMPVGACLSPYLALSSWVGALLALVSQPWELAAAVVGLWGLAGIRWLGS